MKKIWMTLFSVCLFALPGFAESPHRIGGGANYWVAVDDVDVKDVDENGLSYFVSYQYKPGIFGLGVDVELLPDRLGEDTYAPQAYLFIGSGIYAGAGIGILYADSDFADEPFFSLRTGLNIELLPGLIVDIYGQYRFESKKDLENEATDIDTDTVFLGAAVRVNL